MDDKTTAPLNDDVLERVSGGGGTIEYTDQILGRLITMEEFDSEAFQTMNCSAKRHQFVRECTYIYMPGGTYCGYYQKYVCLNCGMIVYITSLHSM